MYWVGPESATTSPGVTPLRTSTCVSVVAPTWISVFFSFPLWSLCVVFVLADLMGAFSASNGVANVAHLAGAAFGFCYRYFDLRWINVSRRLPTFLSRATRRHRPRGWKVIQAENKRPLAPDPETQAVSRQIDQLLTKISREGKESLSDSVRAEVISPHRY